MHFTLKDYLCFDLGGTNIKYGIVTSHGDIKLSNKMPTGKITDGDLIYQRFLALYNELSVTHKIRGIGISSHGVVDLERKVISSGSNYVKALIDYPLAEKLSCDTKLPVILENDVNAAALGELWQGEGKNHQNIVFLTLGTSIGGAIIINGSLYRGKNNRAGEIGYMITQSQDTTNPLIPGAWEGFASSSALMRNYQSAMNDTTLNHIDLLHCIKNNHPPAIKILNQYIHELGAGLVSLAHIFAPDAIILGGAISEEKMLFPQIQTNFAQRVLSGYEHTPILPASCQNHAGILGVASLLNKRS